MTDDIEIRRRRAAWRAAHRGTKELDILVGGYAAARLSGMDEAELGRFERFLTVSDPELQGWLLPAKPDEKTVPDGEFAALVSAVRQFHGLN